MFLRNGFVSHQTMSSGSHGIGKHHIDKDAWAEKIEFSHHVNIQKGKNKHNHPNKLHPRSLCQADFPARKPSTMCLSYGFRKMEQSAVERHWLFFARHVENWLYSTLLLHYSRLCDLVRISEVSQLNFHWFPTQTSCTSAAEAHHS